MDLKELIKYGEKTVKKYIHDIPHLKSGEYKSIMEFGDTFSYMDYTVWRSRVINYINYKDRYMGIKVENVFENFESEYTINTFSEVIAQLYVALDRIDNGISSQYQSINNQQLTNPQKTESSIIEENGFIESLDHGKNDLIPKNDQAIMIKKSKVFIVHGHNKLLLSQTESFVMKLGLEPIILKDQPNKGLTIIEKFKEYSDVDFALVLYTACDEGGEINKKEFRPRARQNVLFEHGYLYAQLGRNRVCALVEKGVEFPSDLSGVVYVEYDDKGKWLFDIAKEMKASGIDVDMNKVVL